MKEPRKQKIVIKEESKTTEEERAAFIYLMSKIIKKIREEEMK